MTIKHLFPTSKPTVDFNFAATRQLDPRITFTRASTGTYIDANGIVQTAAVDEPRFDHDGGTGESLGLLIEESRTNMLVSSEEFDGPNWAQGGPAALTVTANAAVAPDGTTTADKLIRNNGATVGDRRQVITPPNVDGVFSVFAKAGEVSTFNLQPSTSSSVQVSFDVSNGTSFNPGASVLEHGIQDFGGGWYRCWVKVLLNSSTMTIETTAPSTGDGTSGMFFWGAQVEVGACLTSYIPTAGATVTRATDLADITGTNFSSWYNQSESTVYSEFKNIPFGGSMYYFGPGPAPRWWSRYEIANGIRTQAYSGGATSGTVEIAVSGVSNNETIATLKHAVAIDNTSQQHVGSVNGSPAVTGTWDDISGVSKLVVGHRTDLGANDGYLNGHIARFAYYPRRLSDANLEALTS